MSEQPIKHGHQHCPGGPDPIPCLAGSVPWIRRTRLYSDTPQEVDDGGNLLLLFTAVDGSTTPDYEDYWGVPNAFDTQMLTEKSVQEVYGELIFDPNFSEDIFLFFHDDIGYSTQVPIWRQLANQGSGVAFYFHLRKRFTISELCGFSVAVDAAGTKDLIAHYVEFHHVGTYTGTDRQDSEIEQ